MRLTVQDFCQHSTNTLSEGKVQEGTSQTREAFFSGRKENIFYIHGFFDFQVQRSR